jgi:ComEC/Rec2-related protein
LDFQRSGTYHVLVSGMNVSILVTLWVLRRTGLGEVAASASAIVLILAYAVLTNIGPPMWRAALMFAVYLATRLLYRDRVMLNASGAAALALLIVEPEALFGASFQMTFISTEMPEADVLKVAHHGSASSTNEDFRAAVRPRFAVISVETRNVYHHPRTEVLKRLQQAKALTFRTDMDGATSFYLDGKTVTSQLQGLR